MYVVCVCTLSCLASFIQIVFMRFILLCEVIDVCFLTEV